MDPLPIKIEIFNGTSAYELPAKPGVHSGFPLRGKLIKRLKINGSFPYKRCI
jgi:hypothetical protein